MINWLRYLWDKYCYGLNIKSYDDYRFYQTLESSQKYWPNSYTLKEYRDNKYVI